ncbi:polysaccharide deacetylase [Pseudonocardia benzenivorans]|uniref:Polysaccharide deacetylase n=1 Tax=Pseudonocardia benzenivorans TaxID=228005 RepID=A0ABW3VRM2_9PSEU
MRRSRATSNVAIGLALGAAALFLTMALSAPKVEGAGSASAAAPTSEDPQPPPGPPAWMRPLDPGERPPQFVLFSFDGAGSDSHWKRILPLAKKSNAHVTGFLTGLYLVPSAERSRYTGPGHHPGASSVGFGGSAADIETRIANLHTALADGHEIGTHYNGHFCAGSEPSVGKWTTAQWNSELDQFFRFVREAPGLDLPDGTVRGGRTPCLEGKRDALLPAMRSHGLVYDSSTTSGALTWPSQVDGVWEFPMPAVTVTALGKRVIMMDYNLWYSMNGAKEEPEKAGQFTEWTVGAYFRAYDAALAGNRAPLVVGNHFNDWNGGAFSTAVETFMGEVCTRPETVCATYSEVIEWMGLQDPATLAALAEQPTPRP